MVLSDLIRGNKLMRSGDIEKAVAAYRQAIARHPCFHWSYYRLGEALERLGCWDEAAIAYSSAVNLNPQSQLFGKRLKIALHESKQLKEEALVQAKPDNCRKDLKNSKISDKSNIKQVFIVGDHSKLHCGCQAVINYLKDIIVNQKFNIVDSMEISDIVIVNGEGTMHHNSRGYQAKMNSIKLAQQIGKKTYLVNTVWQENNSNYDGILDQLDGLVVRESASQRDLMVNHKVNSIVRIDCSYFCKLNETEIGKNLDSKICITDFYSKDFGGWVRYTGGNRSRHVYLDMKHFTWSGFVNTLKTSSLLITGRQHAVFAACRARIPFVALESNTHKISGFVKMSKIPIPVCETPKDITEAIKWAKNNYSAYQKFFDFLDEQPKFLLSDIGL